ncbi:DUF6292 family protein [Saccharothrix lopnurensis]|uniref:DUF6292 family protein n=1 Tax=Saccharothrix lopnurensis TaxID=1670621 RepID=A0ABW1PIV4_9PSEU
MTQTGPLNPLPANAVRPANVVALRSRTGTDPVRRPRSTTATRPRSSDDPLPGVAAPRRPSAPNDGAHVLARALRDYVWAVAEAVGVPRDGTTCEVTDTATAYLALGCRSADHPDHDVMLVWSASQGWSVLVETSPAEPPVVLARSTDDLVPAPEAVARFVTDSITRRGTGRPPVALPSHADWSDLAQRMEHFASAS